MSAITGPATAVGAEGARVGFCTCNRCGAALLLDPREAVDAIALHRAWHESLDALREVNGLWDGS